MITNTNRESLRILWNTETKAANNQNLAKKTEPAIEAEKTKVKVKVNDTAAEDKRATSPTTTETTGPPAQASLEQPWKTLKT